MEVVHSTPLNSSTCSSTRKPPASQNNYSSGSTPTRSLVIKDTKSCPVLESDKRVEALAFGHRGEDFFKSILAQYQHNSAVMDRLMVAVGNDTVYALQSTTVKLAQIAAELNVTVTDAKYVGASGHTSL